MSLSSFQITGRLEEFGSVSLTRYRISRSFRAHGFVHVRLAEIAILMTRTLRLNARMVDATGVSFVTHTQEPYVPPLS